MEAVDLHVVAPGDRPPAKGPDLWRPKAVRIRHFYEVQGAGLATRIEAWLQHPDREFIALSYAIAPRGSREALLTYGETESTT